MPELKKYIEAWCFAIDDHVDPYTYTENLCNTWADIKFNGDNQRQFFKHELDFSIATRIMRDGVLPVEVSKAYASAIIELEKEISNIKGTIPYFKETIKSSSHKPSHSAMDIRYIECAQRIIKGEGKFNVYVDLAHKYKVKVESFNTEFRKWVRQNPNVENRIDNLQK